MMRETLCLNPFEVREVLQGCALSCCCMGLSLNPFEVREVLQVIYAAEAAIRKVSIPLKSGRCCKGVVLFLQKYVLSQSL